MNEGLISLADMLDQLCVCGHARRAHGANDWCLVEGAYGSYVDGCTRFRPAPGVAATLPATEYHNPSLAPRRDCCNSRVNEYHADDCEVTAPIREAVQPPPQAGNTPVILEAIKYLSDRALVGKQKYGRLLETNNGRDADLDALEEAADLFMYLFQKHLEKQGR